MSNGDSLDGFVFPPFIPPAAARAPEPPTPAPAPAPVAEQPPPAPQSSAPGRMTMPWDVETPIVREGADVSPAAAAPEATDESETEDAEDEDLPWLERPAPREPVAEAPAAPAADAAPATDDAFPDWLAWDDRATDEVRGDVSSVAPVEGLEDFVPADELAFVAPPPAVEWAEAAPDPAQADASDWSLDTPEAVEPPPVPAPAAEVTFDPPAAAATVEPTFEVTLDEGELTFAPVQAAAEPEPAATADPFVADTEAVMAAEPDPFTAASVHEAEVADPVDSAPAAATGGVFDDVAERLEDIAATLRERPDDLLSGRASDPLALLVAGYVMGYGARR